MDLQDLYPAVLSLVLIGVLIGVGITVLDKLAVAVREDTSVLNETVAISGGEGQLGTTERILTFTYFGNDTLNTDNAEINIDAEVNWSANGTLYASGLNFSDDDYNARYTYSKDTEATTKTQTARDAVGDFATWLAVIVVVLASAIIIGLVIRSFGQGR